MNTSATSSSLDVAYWFFQKAEQENLYLENEKLHYLLFAAQNRYAQTHDDEMLMPSLFLCDESGFFEPTLKRIFSQGRPFMPKVHLSPKVTSFLEQIWEETHRLSIKQCKQLMTNLPLYADCYRHGTATVVPCSLLQEQNISAGSSYSLTPPAPRKKILVSQNGPVVVSQWSPRKINQ